MSDPEMALNFVKKFAHVSKLMPYEKNQRKILTQDVKHVKQNFWFLKNASVERKNDA